MMNNYMPILDHLNGQMSKKNKSQKPNESIINKQFKQVIKNNAQRKVQLQAASLVNFTKYLTPIPIFTNFSKKEKRRENFPTHYKAIITLIYQSQTKTLQENYTVFVRNLDTKILYKTLVNWTWSEVALSPRTFCNPMDCSPPDSSVHGIFQARILEWVAISFPRDLPDPGIALRSPALQADSSPSEPPGNPRCRRPRFDSWVWTIPWRRDRLATPVFPGFPCGSAGKESACNAGDLGLIPVRKIT